MSRSLILLLILLFGMGLLPVHTTVHSTTASLANGMGMVGWGGTGIRMTDCATSECNITFPPSIVFHGERASVFEMEASKLSSLGYTAIRASFNPGGPTFPSSGPTPCAQDTSGNLFGVYNATQLQRAIQIAAFYGIYVIVDYHSYDDMTPGYFSCWMNGWNAILNQFRYSYTLIIWEPLNEPSNLPGSSDWSKVNYLGSAYNSWILQARQLGDTHYIVVENYCSNGCYYNVENYWKAYPGAYNNTQRIIDSKNKIYLSLHAGMGWNYDYPVHWNTCQNCEFNVNQYYNYTTADQYANLFYKNMKNGTLNTGFPILNTEGSALPHCGIVQACLNWELASGLNGSAGYTNVTLRFIQKLTTYLSSNNPQYGWVWFPMSSWTETAGAGTYGAMSPNNGWGTKLVFLSVAVMDQTGERYSR